jgi:hypothetical protein
MPWNRRRAYLHEVQLQRTNGALSTAVLELRRELSSKQQYASRLEFLLHQRNERIDELNARLERERLRNRQLDAECEHLADMIRIMPQLAGM